MRGTNFCVYPKSGSYVPCGRDEAGRVIPIEIGVRVLFGKWSGAEVRIDNAERLIMKESDIMGVVIEAAAKKKAV